jgi:hypothetical protein
MCWAQSALLNEEKKLTKKLGKGMAENVEKLWGLRILAAP